ncbi:hypothetical protein B7P43_G12032 [Cryptotermes secundus]|uniref:CWH43-like N-terminal domain-containing protein n=1 Tax=Cryptotermes secundus TaxID=105785 RepID=A0A2J7RD82_9NEOP|nr:hypothetical protein B7P43_G12032 [Cryptotermes secundus]
MKKNPNKSKAKSFTRASAKDRLMYYFGGQLILEVNTFKYLGIIIWSDLRWADHVNYALRKAWKGLHLIMRILNQGNNNKKRLAYMSLLRLILEYGSIFWDPYREWQVSALNWVHRRAAKFANPTDGSDWETLVWISYKIPGLASKWMLRIRAFLVGLCVLTTISTIIPGIVAFFEYRGSIRQKWKPEDGGWELHLASAISEWILCITYCALMCSFVPDFYNLEIEAPIVKLKKSIFTKKSKIISSSNAGIPQRSERLTIGSG